MVLLCRYFTSLVGCVLAAVCYGQSSLFDSITVKQLLGDWKGRLTYLDYQSNKPYTMPADLIVTQLPNGYQLVFSNIYPNEPKANNHDTLTLRDGGKMIDNEVVMSKERLPNGDIEIITEYEGVDGNENTPSTIRRTYTVGKSSFMLRKDIRFKGQAKWINRHEYSYTRK